MTRTATSDATAAIELLAKMLADSPALKVPYCAAEPQRHDCDDGGGIAECHRCVMSSLRKAGPGLIADPCGVLRGRR